MCVFDECVTRELPMCLNAHRMASTIAHKNTYTCASEHGLRKPSTASCIYWQRVHRQQPGIR